MAGVLAVLVPVSYHHLRATAAEIDLVLEEIKNRHVEKYVLREGQMRQAIVIATASSLRLLNRSKLFHNTRILPGLNLLDSSLLAKSEYICVKDSHREIGPLDLL